MCPGGGVSVMQGSTTSLTARSGSIAMETLPARVGSVAMEMLLFRLLPPTLIRLRDLARASTLLALNFQ